MIGEIFKEAYEIMKKRYSAVILTFLFMIFLSFIVALLSNFFKAYGLRYLGLIIEFVFGALIEFGYLYSMLRIYRGDSFSVKFFSKPIENPELGLNYIVYKFLFEALILLGLFLLLIPGIYWNVKYYMGRFFIVDKESGAFEAFSQSSKAVKGRWWLFFKALAAVFAIPLAVLFSITLSLAVAEFFNRFLGAILAVAVLIFAVFAAFPYMTLCYVGIYEKLCVSGSEVS